jgi:ABC-type polysaccharide/polyol phosphate transport system, ATPase component
MALMQLENVTLEYPVSGRYSHSIRTHVAQAVGGRLLGRRGRFPVRWVRALDGISLSLNAGDRLGIIGPNGAGKTSLLRIMSGAFNPTRGTTTINGTVQALTDFTLGMDPYATGRQNIAFRLAFMGFGRKVVAQVMDEIIEFSELGEFIEYPVHTYSSGMYLRLAFAISTHFTPDILIMDEVIGAGDAAFRTKAKERIDDLVGRANGLVLSSHAMPNIEAHCNRAVILRHGSIVFDGGVQEALAHYA